MAWRTASLRCIGKKGKQAAAPPAPLARPELLRSSDKRQALRVRISAEKRKAHEVVEIDSMLEYMQQNYTWVRGKLTLGERGFEIESVDPAQWTKP